jgi:Fe-S oxidoreductase
MATREEKHSTRGRANTLRLAMAGRLGDARLGDHDVYEVLDLCLECRACKAECPVGVDVARFKGEFLAGYWQRHGMPLRTRVIGNVRSVSEWGSRLAPIANLATGSRIGRWINERLLGIDQRRTPPRFARDTFSRRFSRRQSAIGNSQSAILFNDTFTNFNHPEIGLAAADVLAAAGVGVQLAPHGCCGRPLISQGLLAQARLAAQVNVDALFDRASRGERILFLEPSCLSAVREDAPALLRGDAQRRARLVADACLSFEEYVEQRWTSGALQLNLKTGPATVLLHGHCHQKAMGLLPPTRALLSRIPGATVVDLDAGCCGMAGSFGYAKEHYDVSQRIGERKLLPAARGMAPDSVLVAPGTSCREQVKHFTGVKALHPAQLLAGVLSRTS